MLLPPLHLLYPAIVLRQSNKCVCQQEIGSTVKEAKCAGESGDINGDKNFVEVSCDGKEMVIKTYATSDCSGEATTTKVEGGDGKCEAAEIGSSELDCSAGSSLTVSAAAIAAVVTFFFM